MPTTRLVRTIHAEDGTSVFAADDEPAPFHPMGPGRSAFTVFDTRPSVPVNNMDPIPAFVPAIPRCPEQGAIFCITDIQAGDSSPMHRTASIDYCVVVSGEIVLKLDSGEEKTVRPGEFIVQQGVNHQWANNTQEVCRLAFVMVASEKVVIKGEQALESTAR
jgi:quercetin dioxygenase-like cupin family protein